MPHKHTRREKDLATFDLPPSQIAKPLPVDSISKKNAPKKNKNLNRKAAKAAAQAKRDNLGVESAAKNKKRKRADPNHDDAPRAFKRLMAFAGGKKTRSGLDDPGEKPKKVAKEGNSSAPAAPAAPAVPTIRPGERLAEFNHRVDAALPLSGLVSKTVKNGKDPLGLKVWKTKKEMKMHKLYDEWREEDRKIKEKQEEELEAAEEREMEDDSLGVSWKLEEEAAGKKKKKKSKATKYLGEARGAEEDPWAEVKKRRGEKKVGLNDVVQAPPEIKGPGKKFVVRGAAVEVDGIPKSAGSLRKREELQGIRDEVVASYRKRMNKRPGL
ncbi:hypothetical protein GQ53DRAFT_720829 [Thozetella sp. PMI_491]|nr:hypothetical protein GQ53DRAFT_720829 [Thozetella sp. PMI_491]